MNTLKVLEEIALGGDLSVETTRRLESTILFEFPDADDDERFKQLLHILASYRPGGGDYLYDGTSLAEEARRVRSLLTDQSV